MSCQREPGDRVVQVSCSCLHSKILCAAAAAAVVVISVFTFVPCIYCCVSHSIVIADQSGHQSGSWWREWDFYPYASACVPEARGKRRGSLKCLSCSNFISYFCWGCLHYFLRMCVLPCPTATCTTSTMRCSERVCDWPSFPSKNVLFLGQLAPSVNYHDMLPSVLSMQPCS